MHIRWLLCKGIITTVNKKNDLCIERPLRLSGAKCYKTVGHCCAHCLMWCEYARRVFLIFIIVFMENDFCWISAVVVVFFSHSPSAWLYGQMTVTHTHTYGTCVTQTENAHYLLLLASVVDIQGLETQKNTTDEMTRN